MLYKLRNKYLEAYLTFHYQYLPRIMKYGGLKNKLELLKEKGDKAGKHEDGSKTYSIKPDSLLHGDKLLLRF